MNDLHWAGAMLNPFLRGWAPLHEDENLRIILNRVLCRLAPDEDTYVQIFHQYQDFLENRRLFADSTDPNVHVAPLHEWRDAMGGGAKALQTIARRIRQRRYRVSGEQRKITTFHFVNLENINRKIMGPHFLV